MVMFVIEAAFDDVLGHHDNQDGSDSAKDLAEQGLHRVSLVVTTNFLYQTDARKLECGNILEAEDTRGRQQHIQKGETVNTAITNAQLKYMEDRKSPPIATLFSFFISGAGQIYNGQTGKGIAMIVAYIVLWATSYLILPVLFLLFLWVWAMIDANEEAHKFNKALKQNLDEEAASIQSEAERQEKIRASTVTSGDFVNQVDKYFKLFQSSLLSAAEFEAKKKEILIDLTTKKLSESPEDFLTAVIPLIQKKALTDEEIGQVKMAVL